MNPYVVDGADWRSFLKDRWLIFDTDAIISILEYGADRIFNELSSYGVTPCYIHPVLLELMNTDSSKRLARRLLLLETNFDAQLPLLDKDFDRARAIQSKLGTEYRPSPTDLYLASALARFAPSQIALVTGNFKDFPYPHFIRESYITLQNDRNSRVLGILTASSSLQGL